MPLHAGVREEAIAAVRAEIRAWLYDPVSVGRSLSEKVTDAILSLIENTPSVASHALSEGDTPAPSQAGWRLVESVALTPKLSALRDALNHMDATSPYGPGSTAARAAVEQAAKAAGYDPKRSFEDWARYTIAVAEAKHDLADTEDDAETIGLFDGSASARVTADAEPSTGRRVNHDNTALPEPPTSEVG